MRSPIVLACVMAVAAGWTGNAQGQVSTHGTVESFLDAAGATAIENFDSLEARNVEGDTTVLTLPGVTLRSTDTAFGVFNTLPHYLGTYPTHGLNYVVTTYTGGGFAIDFELARPSRAFGLYITDFGDQGLPGSLSLVIGSASYPIATVPPFRSDGQVEFFGVVSASEFSSVRLVSTSADPIGIDEIHVSADGSAPLLRNGGFESFPSVLAFDRCSGVEAGSTEITGWAAVLGNIGLCKQGNAYEIGPSEGRNFLDLTGYSNGGFPKGVRQRVSRLVVGELYRLSLDLGIRNGSCGGFACGGPVSAEVSLGGDTRSMTLDSAAAGDVWKTFEFEFEAVSNVADLTILATSIPVGAIYLGLDNVRLVPLGDSPLASFTLKRSLIAGCRSVSGTVTLSEPAPVGGTVVTISDTLDAATTPLTLKFKQGVLSRSFSVRSSPVAAPESGTVSVSLDGKTLSQPLTLRPMGLQAVTLAQKSVVGGAEVAGTAKLECAAGPGPIEVSLSSSLPEVAAVAPAMLTIPAGEATAAFTVTTVPVLATSKPKIVGTANGITKSRTLTVTTPVLVTPTSLKFGLVPIGTTSPALSTTLSNRGDAPFAVSSIALSGSNAKYYAQANDCPAELAPGAACTIEVRFTPADTRSRSAKLVIGTDVANPVGVALSGTGVTPP
jgi:hypothetical protein